MLKSAKKLIENLKLILGILCLYLFSIYYLFFIDKPNLNSYTYYGQKQNVFILITVIIFLIITAFIMFIIYYWIKKTLVKFTSILKKLFTI